MRIPYIVMTCIVALSLGSSHAQDFGSSRTQNLSRPELQPEMTLPEFAKQNKEFYAAVGQRGTGYRQYKRWENFVQARSYPSGEIDNITAKTWAEHFRAEGS